MSTIKAKLVKVLPVEQGVSKAGKEWKKVTAVFEDADSTSNYPRQFAGVIFGNKVDELWPLLAIGAEYEVTFDIESREFNGRWYTDVNVWRLERVVAAQPAAPQPAAAQPAAPQPRPQQQRLSFNSADIPGADDLPF